MVLMKEAYLFRTLAPEEAGQMFRLILQRMHWMDEQGIRQWNVLDYDKAYPLTYYEEECRKRNAFALEDTSTGEIVCAAVLNEHSEFWSDDEPALYLDHFVAKVGVHGIGGEFLRLAEKLAMERGKHFFRLDSARDNEALGRYYESHGFQPVGVCEDGPYIGIQRQKALVPSVRSESSDETVSERRAVHDSGDHS